MLRRLLWSALGAVAAVAAVACAGGASDPSAPQTREVLVDYVHDEVASSFLEYYPRDVTVRPGDTVLFRQEWTGEAHSVTMGTMVDEAMTVVVPLIEEYGDSPEEPPRPVLRTYDKAMAPLPEMFRDFDVLEVAQNAAQPCYLDTGGPPEEPATPCTDAEQQQPPFNGRQSYYNSGYIHYEGEQGNEFPVELADDIEPGVYNYYCNLHGPFQAGTVTVVEPGATIPSQEDVSRQALAEIEEDAEPLIAAYEEAPREGEATVYGMTVSPPLAGWAVGEGVPVTLLNEFIPSDITVDAGEAVEWSFVGGHTVSFQVPPYFAQIVVEDDGTVVFSPDATTPINSPAPPEPEGGGSGPPEPVVVDAGSWDGEAFTSSGVLFDGIRYRLTFEQPGTYPYACLIHPQMVGRVEVR